MKTPTEIDNWEEFFKAFESVFHHDWSTTCTKLSTIGSGTFLHPQSAEGTPIWENRDALLKAYWKIKPHLDLAVIQVHKFREETAKYETWITGEVFSDGNNLLFRADRPIEGNTTQNVVLLGAQRGLENVLLPIYFKAAEKRATLRLYGVLMPNEVLMPQSWKPKPGAQSLLETVLQEFEMLQHHPRSCVIVMHGFIELLINTLVEEKCKFGKKMASNNRGYPHSVKLTLLYELDLIDEESFKKLSWFRKLRNDAAHEAVFSVTPDNLQMFAGTKFADVSHFPLLCMEIFMSLWNDYPDLFSSKFSPEGHAGAVVAEPVKGRTFTMRDND